MIYLWDELKKIKSMKNKILTTTSVTLLIVFIFFLVFGFKIVNIALLALLLFFIFNFKESRTKLVSYFTANKGVLIALFSMVGFQLLHGAFLGDLTEKRFGFLALLLASAFVLSWIQEVKLISKVYVSCLTLLMVVGSYNMYTYYLSTEDFNMSAGGHIDPMLIVNRPYLGFLLLVGFLTSLFLYQVDKSKKKYVYPFFGLCFVVYLILIGNRIQLVSLIALMLIYVFFYIRIKWYKKLLSLAVFFSGVMLLFSYNSTLIDRFELDSFSKSEDIIQRLERKEPRIVIWKCAMSFTREESFNPWIGVRTLDILDAKLEQCYDQSTVTNPMRDYFLFALFNTHNQFIEYYVLTGIIGVGLFFFLFVLLAVKIKKYFIPMALLIALFNFCLVENLFERQQGGYIFGFVLFLILEIYQSLSKNSRVK